MTVLLYVISLLLLSFLTYHGKIGDNLLININKLKVTIYESINGFGFEIRNDIGEEKIEDSITELF
jgi:hypothetical protein